MAYNPLQCSCNKYEWYEQNNCTTTTYLSTEVACVNRGPIHIWFYFDVFPASALLAFVFFFKLDVRIHQNDINVFYFSEFLAFFTWIQPTRVEELKRPWKNCVVLVAVNDDGRFSGLNFGRRPEFCMAFEMSLIKLWQQA